MKINLYHQLIIIDGGKGQLSSALKVWTRFRFARKIAIIRIAKRLKNCNPAILVPLYLDKKSETAKSNPA